MTMRIALDFLKDRLGVINNDSDDEVIEQMEAAAWDLVQTKNNIVYPRSGSTVEYVTGNGSAYLYLSRPPVAVSPATDPLEDLTVLESAAIGDEGTEIDAAAADGFVLRDSRLVRKGGAVWALGYEYAVTFAGGYAADAEPPMVREAVIQIVSIWYKGLGKEGMRAETSGPSYSYNKDDEGVDSVLLTIPNRPPFG